MPLPPTAPQPGPDTGPRNAEEVLVAPVALAGSGSSRTVSEPLDDAAGWSKVIAFGTDTYYTSPCQRVRIANPVEGHYGGWTITFAEDALGVPDWITTFDRNTPAEVVNAFTTTLVEGLDNNFRDRLQGGRHFTPSSPAALLSERNWQPAGHQPGAHYQLSPDGHAAYRIRLGRLHEFDELMEPELSTWRLSGGLDPLTAPTWRAYFSTSTPQHLITASAMALADHAPVSRFAPSIPDLHLPLVTIHPAPGPQQPRAAAALARSTRAPRNPDAASPVVPAQAAYSTPPRRQR
ncbi:hypothetical protein SLAV_05795 [Streptomyces lavendulae subsp. lavendulae]|uniref:Uncharacterized protein n=1 Tax=Streptomyces lavendulae subsp. lavendulae TaxID=58340 RepID=A0A2K8P8K0_STRLA|nr:hypothetical protein SLAV_05795 [Streptomyces lavendulae subsp. lavendulae]QUQ52903.1 hypothetical protein SLLC_03820 [Streptomyces lavendulae subsp. lavendulae]